MTTTDELVATVRKALSIGMVPDNQADREKLDAGHDALDALQAQAETAETLKDKLKHARDRWHDAEAERDAAVQAAEQLDKERQDAYRIASKTAEKLRAAEQAAEQARNALQKIADTRLDSRETWREHVIEFQALARAALAGNQT